MIGRRLFAGSFLLVIALMICLPSASLADERSAARELAENHVPVLMIREQEDPLCGTAAEQYQVMKVDALFGSPEVKLMRVG